MTALALIDAGGANIGSVRYALGRLGVEAQLTTDAQVIRGAQRVILPGVGAAAQVMARLRELDLIDTLRSLEAPLLGVCVGMQVLFEHSEEDDTPCLGLLAGRVGKLPVAAGIRVPHMGWNTLTPTRAASLTAGIGAQDQAYFVHSYAAPVGEDCLSTTTHGQAFAAVVQRGRVAGAQFHPERSAATGARLLRNFIEYGLA
ncbi:imidazole glycerol phosphate synthase subunit HisH [Pseudoxanthomonas winnipegensis]|uniref:Imidazole glycerol phosphate synthase subunit HisH n=1 Tax=Pseudoxanthomonas winnipegensis TaxID=2480810 RepID=A0A4Q8L620_9GAMM|nr:imidazole glycerol phosphate synthase subunit HisH [Pseudoxanthomonas winnipegensis]PZP61921.1 MAG: imidazole glycerol phosphate synthase subunit HisH [Pseudoxanthomonas spadix]TAA21924.1 imidazole glycerol phosphate synthase subunit HisH [Pseudoxanthomonas winnipegensis]